MKIQDVQTIIDKIKPPKKRCDTLWALCIKAKAGFICEYSGEHGTQIGGEKTLNAHHILGKKNLALRYSLDNGICLTGGVHKYVAHNPNLEDDFKEWIGDKRLNKIRKLKHGIYKINLKEKEKELFNYLEKLLK